MPNENSDSKMCRRCETVLSLSLFGVGADKDGLNHWCKSCKSLYQKVLYHKNPVKARKYFKEYNKRRRAAHADEYNAKIREYRRRNKERTAFNRKQARLRNIEKYSARDKAYRETHREQARQRSKDYYSKNKERAAIYGKRWWQVNPDKVSAYHHKRRARSRVGLHFSGSEWSDLKRFYGENCLCCQQSRKLTADHIIPLSQGGSNGIWNIQPLCRSCNSKKGVKTIDYRGYFFF